MSSSMYGATGGYRSGSPRERAVSSALSLAIIVLMILLAIWQSGHITRKFGMGKGLTTFDIASSDKAKSAAPTPSRQAAAKARSRVVSKTATPQKPRIVLARSKAVQQQELAIPGFIHMSRDDFAAGDIGKMHGPAMAQGGGNGGGKMAYGPGEGPGGMHLFPVEWYREPTDAELSTYMPKTPPGDGWGEVACDTIEHYHVENCQIIGESPRGSGYGRAVLNAAWQFLVRPPRVNGELKIGAPVRIRITYSERGARPL
jgi:protein TonB